jgi:NAD(P)-dependent dehydrogenase (short-subunit alcohol dehydrogenase family)
MFDSAETAFGGIDVLINNTGIMNLPAASRATATASTGVSSEENSPR